MERRTLPVILLAISAASLVVTAVLASYGVYFFFFLLPVAFGIPWSVKRLWKSRARKQWNVEDLR